MAIALRTFIRSLPLLAAVCLAGCASAPQQPAAPHITAKPRPTPQTATEKPQLKRHHPLQYVVKKGDTLWDIANRFLENPWLWPDIWYVNPQIRNPHLIYPGDVIELRWVNGKPQLTLKGAQTGLPVVRLHPQVHRTSIEEGIPTIPIADIRAFLTRSPVLDPGEMAGAPYVVATADGRLLAGHYRTVFVRGVDKKKGDRWIIVRKGEPLIDPASGELLGYQGIYAGAGDITAWGDPATLQLTDSTKGVRVGDRLLPRDGGVLPINFYPHAPKTTTNGLIVSVLGGVSQVGQYDVVVLNRGENAGIDPGEVFAIYQRGRLVEDPYSDTAVKLPDQRAGLLMVFRTFDRVSYGLVMELNKEVHIGDRITNP